MKQVALLSLHIYTRVVSPAIHQLLGIKTVCRYEVSCSRYAGVTIEKYGVLKGGYLAIRRVINCQPYFNL